MVLFNCLSSQAISEALTIFIQAFVSVPIYRDFYFRRSMEDNIKDFIEQTEETAKHSYPLKKKKIKLEETRQDKELS